MSQQNVEIVRAYFEAANRSDFAQVMSTYSPDVELIVDPPVITAGTYSGRDSVGRFFGDWFRTFGGSVHFDLRDLREMGEAVVVAANASGRGGHSGADVAMDVFYVFRLRADRIVGIRLSHSMSDALKAAGLSEQAMSHEIMVFAERALVAVNETYRTGDMLPWRQHVEETFSPDIVLESSGEAFTEGEWRGHEGAVGFVANQMEVLDEMWLRVDEYLHVDPELLVAAISFGGRARHTGIEVELHPLHVFRLHDGKAVRWQVFLDRTKALEAAGLSE